MLRRGGITFDATGYFGHKLLVTVSNHAETTVLAIDCAGGVIAARPAITHAEGHIAFTSVGR